MSSVEILEIRCLTPSGQRSTVYIADGAWLGYRNGIRGLLGLEPKQAAILRAVRDQLEKGVA